MKLTQGDKKILEDFGHKKSDFKQIEMAMQKSKTVYTLGTKQITREMAIELLGKKRYLAGLSRSAFHYTAAQPLEDDSVVYFNSYNLFKS